MQQRASKSTFSDAGQVANAMLTQMSDVSMQRVLVQAAMHVDNTNLADAMLTLAEAPGAARNMLMRAVSMYLSYVDLAEFGGYPDEF